MCVRHTLQAVVYPVCPPVLDGDSFVDIFHLSVDVVCESLGVEPALICMYRRIVRVRQHLIACSN